MPLEQFVFTEHSSSINVVYASDNNYAEIAGVSILSLFENNKGIDEIKLFFLDSGISVDNKAKLNSIADIYSRKIRFIKVHDIYDSFDVKIDVQYWSLAAFSRLFIPFGSSFQLGYSIFIYWW